MFGRSVLQLSRKKNRKEADSVYKKNENAFICGAFDYLFQFGERVGPCPRFKHVPVLHNLS
jgi:hypothetical protein